VALSSLAVTTPLIPRFYCVAALVLLLIVTLSLVQIAISFRYIASRMPPTQQELQDAVEADDDESVKRTLGRVPLGFN